MESLVCFEEKEVEINLKNYFVKVLLFWINDFIFIKNLVGVC